MELAALLYSGDYIHARHCWRRHRDAAPPTVQAALEEWWTLGRAMMEFDLPRVWSQLTSLQQTQPQPYKGYAQEIGAAVCRALLPKLATLWNKQQQQQDVLLGLPRHEWVLFLEQHRTGLAAAVQLGGGDHATEIISFLEGPFLTV